MPAKAIQAMTESSSQNFSAQLTTTTSSHPVLVIVTAAPVAKSKTCFGLLSEEIQCWRQAFLKGGISFLGSMTWTTILSLKCWAWQTFSIRSMSKAGMEVMSHLFQHPAPRSQVHSGRQSLWAQRTGSSLCPLSALWDFWGPSPASTSTTHTGQQLHACPSLAAQLECRMLQPTLSLHWHQILSPHWMRSIKECCLDMDNQEQRVQVCDVSASPYPGNPSPSSP